MAYGSTPGEVLSFKLTNKNGNEIHALETLEFSIDKSVGTPEAPFILTTEKTETGMFDTYEGNFVCSVYPNPFNDHVNISISLIRLSDVSIDIVDVEGRVIKQLHDGELGKGIHNINWNTSDKNGVHLGYGVYFARIKTDAGTVVRKIVKLK